MSIAEFTSALKDKAYKDWFKRSNINTLRVSLEDMRASQETKERTSFAIDKQTIALMLEKLGKSNTKAEVDALFTKLLKDQTVSTVRRARFDNNTIVFPKIGFDTITTVLNRLFDTKAGEISQFFEKGHVLGIATVLTDITAERIKTHTEIADSNKEIILQYLDRIVQQLRELDYETSNLKDPKAALYAKYTKSRKKYLVEMQLKDANQASGRQIRSLMGTLRSVFDPFDNLPAIATSSAKSARSKEKLIEAFMGKAGAKDSAFFESLVSMKGSPSQLDLIEQELVSILKTGKSIPDRQYTVPEVLVSTHTLAKLDKSKAKAQISKDIQKVQALKRDLKNKLRWEQTKQFASLINIQNLLNQKLHDQIQQNMGSPRLNYKTGRFAKSAKVTNMTISRQGMITAFYTYMKYPYQTFEPGYAQGSIQRDPKTLISKSIREIAVTLVGNRLRAVRV